LIRFSILFEYSSISLLLMSCVGSSTAILGACTSLVQTDIKKVVAYSTSRYIPI
jgi:NADH:ubiquinone oxidoreductase subunit 5 (subunit L)/multisubunit Na+/H+ antiporter MnhA subunit